jgi:hypothetical protein
MAKKIVASGDGSGWTPRGVVENLLLWFLWKSS